MRYSENKAIGFAGIIAVGAVGTYMWWFFVEKQMPLSTDTGDWGSFGSFLAGTAGVSFALATVWMLAETLKLQRHELEATRKELELTREEAKRSSDALASQAKAQDNSNHREKNYYFVRQVSDSIDEIMREKRLGNTNSNNLQSYFISRNTHLPMGDAQFRNLAKQFAILFRYIYVDKSTPSSIKHELTGQLLTKYEHVIIALYEKSYFDIFRDEIQNSIATFVEFQDETLMKVN